jgi:hypothetical protein
MSFYDLLLIAGIAAVVTALVVAGQSWYVFRQSTAHHRSEDRESRRLRATRNLGLAPKRGPRTSGRSAED